MFLTMVLFFLFFFAGNLGSQDPNIPKNTKPPKYLAKKKKKGKTPFIRKMLCRGTLNTCVCNVFQGLISQKRRGRVDIGL